MNTSPRGAHVRESRWLRGATAAILTSATVIVLINGSASGTLAPNTFEGNDGNLVVNTSGNTDWANVPNRATGIDVLSGSNDNAFGQGAKEDASTVAIVNGSIPPNKNDLTRFYEASQTDPAGNIYLDLAWERAVNLGSANMDFEINQKTTPAFTTAAQGSITLNRTAGDVLVSYQFGGSGTPTILISRWKTALLAGDSCNSGSAPCWANQKALTGGQAEAAVNTGTVGEPILGATATLTAGLFGETSINLTAAGVFPAGSCEAFGSVFVKSRSSGSSFNSELKDFIAPVPVNISNCSSLTIKKVTTNDPAGTQTFSFQPSSNLSGSSFALANGDTKAFPKLSADTYTVQESAEPSSTAGTWSYVGFVCDNPAATSSTTSTTASVTLGLGQNVTCTFTNHFTNAPVITTTLSSTTIVVGHSVTDSATLTGASQPATGTVTYKVWTDSTCQTPYALGSPYVGNSFGAQNLNANGTLPDSPAYVFTSVPSGGKVYYSADYTSSGANAGNNANDTDCNEPLTISPASPSAATAQDLLPNDSFSLTGQYGSVDTSTNVTFKLYGPTDTTCSGTPTRTWVVGIAADGTAATSNTTYHATGNGTWHWSATWPGDSNNNPASSICAESFTITQ